MGVLGDSKAELQAAVARLEMQVDMLSKENDRLHKQVETLQEAIVSKVAPIAYAEMKADQSALEDNTPTTEEIQTWQEEMAMGRKYIEQIEQPFFSDPDDMIEKLTAMMGGPQAAATSIHDNEES